MNETDSMTEGDLDSAVAVVEKPDINKSSSLKPYSKQHIFPEEYLEEQQLTPKTKEGNRFDFVKMVKELIAKKTYSIRGVSPEFDNSKIDSYQIEPQGSGGLGARLVNNQGQIVALMPFWVEGYNEQGKYIIKEEGPYNVSYEIEIDQDGKEVKSKEVMRVVRVEGAAGVVPDPEPADLTNPDAARAWLARQLRSCEGINSEIDLSILSSLLATISGRVPDALGVRGELLVRARARILYHNTSIRARFRLGDIMEVFGQLQLPEHQEILETPGVKETIKQLIFNDGEYFRLRNIPGGIQHATGRKNDIIIRLQTPAGGGLTLEQATLAFELGEKFAHMTGESSYYDGIQDNAGNWQHFEHAGTSEANYEGYANYLVDHWNDINQNASINGQGSANMRAVFYLPLFLEKPVTDNRGQAAWLRRYVYLWMNSAVHFRNPAFAAKMDLLDFANDISGQWVKWIIWMGKVSKAHSSRGQLNEKGAESILNVPLIEPNTLRQDTSEQVINGVMDNYKKAIAAFGHLTYPIEIHQAMSHLLRGVMEYVSERHINQARNEGFITWLGINQNQMFSVVRWAAKVGAITYEQAAGLRHQLDLTLFRVAVGAAAPHLGQSIGAGLRSFWRGITGR